MKFLFRADASIQIGSGHIMRCLTLATALREKGHLCTFLCREHEGNLISLIQAKGFEVKALPVSKNSSKNDRLFHSAWLGATQQEDALDCIDILKTIKPDWVVVDHYALDSEWEKQISVYCQRIFVIDDLADRKHHCQLLLDQTLNRQAIDYKELVDWTNCQVLTGTEFALLRPEFEEWREYSLNRRSEPTLKNILVNLGGVDKDNITEQVLIKLEKSNLAGSSNIEVIMGASAPHVELVKQFAENSPLNIYVSVNVTNMAEKLTQADLVIGAAGGSSWERCCLGVPTLLLVLAENQNDIATILDENEIAKKARIQNLDQILNSLTLDELAEMTKNAQELIDGKGVQRIVARLEN